MRNRFVALVTIGVLAAASLMGCGNTSTETEQDTVRNEQVPGNVERQDVVSENEQDEAADPEAESQNEAPQETAEVQETMADTTPVTSEAQIYLEQGYYIVQKGDSLIDICKKIYQTTAMMDKLCEVNGIENQDAIYAGQYLTLPN